MSFAALNWAWDASTRSGTAKCVLAYLANCANDRGESWPSVSTICRKTRHGEAAVRRALRELEEDRHIERMQRPVGDAFASTLYRLPVAVPRQQWAQEPEWPEEPAPAASPPPPSKSQEGDTAKSSPPPTPPPSLEIESTPPSKSQENPSLNLKRGSPVPPTESKLRGRSPTPAPRGAARSRVVVSFTPEQEVAFGQFWAAYPKKRDKLAARRAFKAALERGVLAEDILGALGSYRFSDEERWIKHPATWLNAGCYEDEAVEASSGRFKGVLDTIREEWGLPTFLAPRIDPEPADADLLEGVS